MPVTTLNNRKVIVITMLKWKQFLTPVRSLNGTEADQLLRRNPPGTVTILDVRQPREYEKGHIPGAVLIPLPELPTRMTELESEQTTVVYCAVGGRSRVAAQMLNTSGFTDVYNLSGGFKDWQGDRAVGDKVSGLALFDDAGTPREIIARVKKIAKTIWL